MRYTTISLVWSFIALSCTATEQEVSAIETSLRAYADPFIGTAGEGNTYPGAVAPWGMVSVSPHNVLSTPMSYLTNEPMAPSGYLYGESVIKGFGFTHLSGTGCPDLGAPVVMPTVGDIVSHTSLSLTDD